MAFLRDMAEASIVSVLGSRKYLPIMAKANQKDLAFIADLVVAGKVKPVIGRRYRLSDAVEALQHLEQGHARGKVIITMDDGEES